MFPKTSFRWAPKGQDFCGHLLLGGFAPHNIHSPRAVSESVNVGAGLAPARRWPESLGQCQRPGGSKPRPYIVQAVHRLRNRFKSITAESLTHLSLLDEAAIPEACTAAPAFRNWCRPAPAPKYRGGRANYRYARRMTAADGTACSWGKVSTNSVKAPSSECAVSVPPYPLAMMS